MATTPKINITPDMMRSFKTLTCDCGGQLFQTGIVVKKISALVSPTGNEETYPMEVLICMKCNKVPNELNPLKMLPDAVLATPVPASAKFEFSKGTVGNPVTNTFTLKNDGGKSPLSIVRDENPDPSSKIN